MTSTSVTLSDANAWIMTLSNSGVSCGIGMQNLQGNTGTWLNVFLTVHHELTIQGVPGGMEKLRESVPYVKIYRYNPKHLYPKLNG